MNIPITPLSNNAFTNTPSCISTFFIPIFSYTSLKRLRVLLISLCSLFSLAIPFPIQNVPPFLNSTMASSCLFYTLGTRFSSFLPHISLLLSPSFLLYFVYLTFVSLSASTSMLLSSLYTIYFLIVSQRQILAHNSPGFSSLYTCTLHTLHMLLLPTLYSILSFLVLCFSGVFPMCYYIPTPLSIRVALAFSIFAAPLMDQLYMLLLCFFFFSLLQCLGTPI